uniref:Uncharacterized protein n=1 Tax=Octopus bimaculoides TaxID=37653 RepID=A0A0L8HPX6_OCTBM
MEGRILLEFCDVKEWCVESMWFRKTEKRKVTFSAGGNETEINFMLVGRRNRKYLRDVKTIPGELQHRLVVADLDKKKVKKCMRKGTVESRKVWKLKEEETRARFEELVSIDAMDLWNSFKKGVLKVCDEVCGRMKDRRDQGDMW